MKIFSSYTPVAICIMAIVAMFANSCNMLCNDTTVERTGKKLARAYDEYLYSDDIAHLLPENVNSDDSSLIIKSYIDNWVKEKVMLRKAEENIGDYEKQIEERLTQYRNTLVVYAYQKAIVSKQLDTLVNDEAIEKYYEDNKNNFLLKENIARCVYAKFYNNTPELKKIKQWMQSGSEEQRDDIDNFCIQYAFDYFINDDVWLSFSDIMQRTGIKTYNQEQYLQNTRYVELPDSSTVTVVKFYDFKIKESLSPLSFERDNIRNLIVNKRKLDLINSIEQKAFDNAVKKGEFEIFKH